MDSSAAIFEDQRKGPNVQNNSLHHSFNPSSPQGCCFSYPCLITSIGDEPRGCEDDVSIQQNDKYHQHDYGFVEDLKTVCLETVNKCMLKAVHDSKPRISSSLSTASKESSLFDEGLKDLMQSVSTQLDDVVDKAVAVYSKKQSRSSLFASFAINDLERAIAFTVAQSMMSIRSEKFAPDLVRLGRVYAWARRPATMVAEDSEATDAQTDPSSVSRMRCIQKQLCRLLSHLIWLSRTGRSRARADPMLISMRHDLLRIRTRMMGHVSMQQTAAMGPLLQHVPSVDRGFYKRASPQTAYGSLKRIAPSVYHDTFEKVIQQFTDIATELAGKIPGFPSVLPGVNKREVILEVVTQTVYGFYCQCDLELGDEGKNGNMAVKDVGSSESAVSDQEEGQGTEGPGSKSKTAWKQLNPATVQATLDRFDHRCREIQKRAVKPSLRGRSMHGDVEEELAVLTEPVIAPSTPVKPVPVAVSVISESLKLGKDELDLSKLPQQNLFDAKKTPPHDDEPLVSQKPNKVVTPTKPPDTEKPSETDSAKPNGKHRKSYRSLRTRRARTPSNSSYSEGEVVSDSEEEQHEERRGCGLADERVATQLNASGGDSDTDRRDEELIRMVNAQLRPPTPTSDVDFTELEIMDEWALPSSTVTMASHSDDEQGQTEAKPPSSKRARTSNSSATTESGEPDGKITAVLKEALRLCSENLDDLVVHNDSKAKGEKQTVETQSARLPGGTEASIERVVSVFKDHVASVLNNLLHAAPSMPDSPTLETTEEAPTITTITTPTSSSNTPRPAVTGQQRGSSRLLGMLRAYQQDVMKRTGSPTS